MSYDNRQDDLVTDTQAFLKSEYGQYLVSTLEEMQEGHLTATADVNAEHPERYAAKFSAIKDVLNLIYSPLDDNTPSHG